MVELYAGRDEAAAVSQNAGRVRHAADELTRQGRPVRYVRSIFVPEDETCFYLFEAGSADDVLEAARRAELPVDHVAEAITAAAH
jgi:hypothetical protein